MLFRSRLSYVWLSLKRGLGSRTAAEVLDAFGSPEAVFAADRQALTAAPCELRKTHVDLLCDKDTSEAEQVTVPVSEVNVGDLFLVRPGESIPVDGILILREKQLELFMYPQ